MVHIVTAFYQDDATHYCCGIDPIWGNCYWPHRRLGSINLAKMMDLDATMYWYWWITVTIVLIFHAQGFVSEGVQELKIEIL